MDSDELGAIGNESPCHGRRRGVTVEHRTVVAYVLDASQLFPTTPKRPLDTVLWIATLPSAFLVSAYTPVSFVRTDDSALLAHVVPSFLSPAPSLGPTQPHLTSPLHPLPHVFPRSHLCFNGLNCLRTAVNAATPFPSHLITTYRSQQLIPLRPYPFYASST